MPIIDFCHEITSHLLYDSAPIIAGTVQLFCVPIGGSVNGQTKTWLDTNMMLACTLPTPQKYLARRMQVLFLSSKRRPILLHQSDLYGQAHVRFSVNRKSYFDGPAWKMISPLGVFGTPEIQKSAMVKKYGDEWNTPADFRLIKLSEQGPAEWQPGKTGVLIETQEVFDVQVTINEKVSWPGAIVSVCFEGVLLRPVM